MKKLIFIVFLILLYNVSAVELTQGEVSNYHGHEIKVVSIQEGKAIISIDDEKEIFDAGESTIIKGVQIKLEDIFYANGLSTVGIDLSLTYECGDDKCGEYESSVTCCQDCPCPENKKCIDDECKIPECINDIDCNDNNELTNDVCEDYNCKFKMIKCKKDSDCDDSNPDTDDTCVNKKCNNILNYICKENIDCDDQNPCTEDLCINKDCQYNVKENCEVKEEDGKKVVVKKGFFSRLFNWLKNIF